MYQALTNAYEYANARDNARNANKQFRYRLLNKAFQPMGEGICINVQKDYDPCSDSNIVYFTDLATGKRCGVSQFYIELTEEEGIKK